MIGLNCKFRCNFENWNTGGGGSGGGGGGGGGGGSSYYSYSGGGGGGGSSHDYTYYSDADDDSEWDDYFRAEFLTNEASKSAWSQIYEAERNLDMLDSQKRFYDDEFDKQQDLIDKSFDNSTAMARRTADNDFVKNLQDIQSATRQAMSANGGQYGSWSQSLNDVLDEGWAQQNQNNANTLEYNLQDALDSMVNKKNDSIRSYNDEMLTLDNSRMNIDSNLKSGIEDLKRNLAGNLASLSEYDPRSQYIGDWGAMLDDADKSGWFQYGSQSIDGTNDRDYLASVKDYKDPVLQSNIKTGDQIAKKLAGYSTDNGVLERLTSSYSNRERR